jgi:hypothetical protein
MRDTIARIAAAAEVNCTTEHQLFAYSADKLDLYFPNLRQEEKAIVADVTINYSLEKPTLHKIAPGYPGSAATLNEGVKRAKYGAMCDTLGLHLVPIAFDTYGALGESGCNLMKELARRIGALNHVPPSVAIPKVMTQLVTRFMCGIGHLLTSSPGVPM